MFKNNQIYKTIKKSGLFDSVYYLINNPDVRRADIDPLQHFIEYGWKEGRNPSSNFNTKFYLESNLDIKESGMNPLFHFIRYGQKEGRNPIIKIEENAFDFLGNEKDNINLENLKFQPLISVLVPIYNTPIEFLIQAIESVRNQLYTRWEICICDDCSSNRITINELKRIREIDSRIKIIFLQTKCGIAAASNKAAQLAAGDYFAFLDHDDLLTPDALYEIVKTLNTNDADIIYSDQDKIDITGKQVNEPFYKPDWSPIFLCSKMYVGHLLVVKRELFNRINGLNSEFDGVQDFDFILRASETKPNIYHIPKILYHWRKIPGSVAMGSDEKGEKIEILQKKAVNEHIARLDLPFYAENHPTSRHTILLQPKKLDNFPLISIVILSKDAPNYIGRCLKSIFSKTTYPNFEVVVVDNETTDRKALNILESYPIKTIAFNRTFNYSIANNIGVKNTKGDYLILLNNDTEIVTPNWIELLLQFCILPQIGAVGPLLIYPNKTVQHAGIVLGFRGTADHIMRNFPSESEGYFGSLCCPHEVSAITGACLMVKREDYLMIGGLSEYYGTHYQDVDFCLRLRENGKNNIFVPYSVLVHHENITRGTKYDFLDRALLLDLWDDQIKKGDPYYSPNFSLENPNEFYKIK